MMVAIPELDGAIGPMVFGGRSTRRRATSKRAATCVAASERADDAGRARRHVWSRCAGRPRAERKIAIVLFNFPPNAGNVGTAAYLSVFESLLNTLRGMADAGYTSMCPTDVDALRDALLGGNARALRRRRQRRTRASPADDHVRRERWLEEIEAQWGPAPGRQQSDGASLFVLGAHFGNVFVGVQPAFGYEGDPMRLLFERASRRRMRSPPSTAGSREDFGADAVLHFGTHGALEFMPGKQTGHVGRLLARSADRRPAELLPLRLEQSVRGHDRQAPRRPRR